MTEYISPFPNYSIGYVRFRRVHIVGISDSTNSSNCHKIRLKMLGAQAWSIYESAMKDETEAETAPDSAEPYKLRLV